MSVYTEASRALYAVFEELAPVVEGLSIDEAFLDARGWDAVEIAKRIRAEVRSRVGIPVTVGIARTKFLAKVASGVAKPDGLLFVPPGRELRFLHALPVERLWGVGDVTAARLHEFGVTTVGEVAAMSESALVSLLGRAAGRQLHALAHNRDPRRVTPRRRRGSIGAQCALGRRRRSPEDVDAVLLGLVDRVTRRMRAAHRIGRTVTLRLRFDDFTRATRAFTLDDATAETQAIFDVARGLLAAEARLVERRGLTLVGVAVSNLADDTPLQLPLPFVRRGDLELDLAIDACRDRFGLDSVKRAVLLGRESGLAMPLLPD
jgi:DNA polymerase-4